MFGYGREWLHGGMWCYFSSTARDMGGMDEQRWAGGKCGCDHEAAVNQSVQVKNVLHNKLSRIHRVMNV